MNNLLLNVFRGNTNHMPGQLPWRLVQPRDSRMQYPGPPLPGGAGPVYSLTKLCTGKTIGSVGCMPACWTSGISFSPNA